MELERALAEAEADWPKTKKLTAALSELLARPDVVFQLKSRLSLVPARKERVAADVSKLFEPYVKHNGVDRTREH